MDFLEQLRHERDPDELFRLLSEQPDGPLPTLVAVLEEDETLRSHEGLLALVEEVLRAGRELPPRTSAQLLAALPAESDDPEWHGLMPSWPAVADLLALAWLGAHNAAPNDEWPDHVQGGLDLHALLLGLEVPDARIDEVARQVARAVVLGGHPGSSGDPLLRTWSDDGTLQERLVQSDKDVATLVSSIGVERWKGAVLSLLLTEPKAPLSAASKSLEAMEPSELVDVCNVRDAIRGAHREALALAARNQTPSPEAADAALRNVKRDDPRQVLAFAWGSRLGASSGEYLRSAIPVVRPSESWLAEMHAAFWASMPRETLETRLRESPQAHACLLAHGFVEEVFDDLVRDATFTRSLGDVHVAAQSALRSALAQGDVPDALRELRLRDLACLLSRASADDESEASWKLLAQSWLTGSGLEVDCTFLVALSGVLGDARFNAWIRGPIQRGRLACASLLACYEVLNEANRFLVVDRVMESDPEHCWHHFALRNALIHQPANLVQIASWAKGSPARIAWLQRVSWAARHRAELERALG